MVVFSGGGLSLSLFVSQLLVRAFSLPIGLSSLGMSSLRGVLTLSLNLN